MGTIKFPSMTTCMEDADEGNSQGDVVGAPPGKARNNRPDPWDNHGAILSNFLYYDGHAKSRWWNDNLLNPDGSRGRFVN